MSKISEDLLGRMAEQWLGISLTGKDRSNVLDLLQRLEADMAAMKRKEVGKEEAAFVYSAESER
ncbi:MAG: hypothetical protein KatS3mg105_2282 [Gemmatales bacterium]|nr:MAG: hypothetical protein KatS3mg105_2282 [Gemmatales bacterium]